MIRIPTAIPNNINHKVDELHTFALQTLEAFEVNGSFAECCQLNVLLKRSLYLTSGLFKRCKDAFKCSYGCND